MTTVSDSHDATQPGIPVRILLADRAGSTRRVLSRLLKGIDGVLLVGEVGERDELAAAVTRADPDMLVIDDRMLDDDYQALSALGRHLRILVMGVDDDPGFAERARRQGAEAWIAKERADEQLPAHLARAA